MFKRAKGKFASSADQGEKCVCDTKESLCTPGLLSLLLPRKSAKR